MTSLRAAALDPGALIPLIDADPDTAAELLVAAIIKTPGRNDYGLGGMASALGVVDPLDTRATIPENGPFDAFFVRAPEAAMSALLRIVDHATAGWAASDWTEHDDLRADLAFEVLIDGAPVALTGNGTVMLWHHGDSRVPSPLAVGLMALEKTIYARLDAGETVDDLLAPLLASRSVAVYGLLGDIACYRSDLLDGLLAPLATSIALILGDRIYKSQSQSHLLLTASTLPADVARLREWHQMPHRRRPLQTVILERVLSDPRGAVAQALEAGRARWLAVDPQRWKFLAAGLDPANYREADISLDDNTTARGWTYETPADLAAELADEAEERAVSEWWLTTAVSLRQLFDQVETLSDEQADALWADASRHWESGPPDALADAPISAHDVWCGFAALFVVKAGSWLAEHPEVDAWCRSALRAPFAEPPGTFPVFSDRELVDTSWDGFAADAIPTLWAVTPADVELRGAAVRLAIHPHLRAVARFSAHVAAYSGLRDDLRRLDVVALHYARFMAWSRERDTRAEQAQYWGDDGPRADDLPDLVGPTEACLAAFVDGSLTTELPDLEQFVADTPAEMLRRAGRDRLGAVLDLSRLLAGWGHLLQIQPDLDEVEIHRRLRLGAAFACLLSERIHVERRHDLRSPATDEGELILYLGGLTAQAPTLADARPIWEPILDAGGPAHYWVSRFLSGVWGVGLTDPTPPTFAALIEEMIAFAGASDRWRPPLREESNELALIALDRFSARMHAQHGALFRALLPTWKAWVEPRLRGPYFALPVVRFLADPVAAPAIDDALVWLARRESGGARVEDDLDDAMAELLVKLHARDSGLLRRAAEPGPSARALLAALAGRQNTIALELSASLPGG